eukprot:TRINITY_DN3706_c0_g1_i2.p1 TRINITY_DN3706_c0_g1~~TRINITY_DN3706_c0_g1_i2.p1  ORF type:complete len:207 (+),score=30.63 TRINITY_DN3706_c0_g1_i2:67-687(+)
MQSSIDSLVGMGFTKEAVLKALGKCNNNPNDAIDYLLSTNGGEEESDSELSFSKDMLSGGDEEEEISHAQDDLKGVEKINDIPYGDGHRHYMDIYVSDRIPKTGHAPVLVHVHGGGWVRGDKGNAFYGAPFITNHMAMEGFVTVAVNYRTGSKFPNHAYDVANAIKWVYYNIDMYRGDKTKIFLSGHSAGNSSIIHTFNTTLIIIH